MTQYSNLSQNPRRGGRRPRKEYELSTLTQEEREKKFKRRQANKEAAARSRKKKNDQIASLEKDKEALQNLNFQMGLHYNTLKNIAEEFVRSFQAHITSHSSNSSCVLRDDNALMKLEMLSQTLHTPPPSTYLFQTNGHQQQSQQQSQQQFVQQTNSSDNTTVFLPPESKTRKIENIGGSQLQYPQQQQISQPQRFPRPNSLSLSRLNVNDDSCVSPTSSAEENEEYKFLNQQTFLTPILPNDISVSSTATTMPPLQFDDLQDF